MGFQEASVDISGYGLSDKETDPYRYTFPAGTVVPAKGSLVVYCDSNGIAEAVKNPKAPVGLMDVLSIPKLDADYRVLLTPRGKLTLVKIEKDEASWKLCRIEDKTVVKGGKIQLNLHDGRNILLDKNDYKTGDVLKVSFDGQKIVEAFPLQAGAAALVSSGNHAGQVETVEEYEVIKGPSENIVKFKSGTETVKSNVFVIGASAPAIKLPEAEN